jgi:hypothetical protein
LTSVGPSVDGTRCARCSYRARRAPPRPPRKKQIRARYRATLPGLIPSGCWHDCGTAACSKSRVCSVAPTLIEPGQRNSRRSESGREVMTGVGTAGGPPRRSKRLHLFEPQRDALWAPRAALGKPAESRCSATRPFSTRRIPACDGGASEHLEAHAVGFAIGDRRAMCGSHGRCRSRRAVASPRQARPLCRLS